MKRKLIHFDRNEAGNLHCDTCGHDLLPGTVVWGQHLIGYECPKCSDSMLTERDYLATSKMFARIDWLNKWFSWVPFLATGDLNNPDLQTVGIRIHNRSVEITAEPASVPPASQNRPTVPNLSRTSCVFEYVTEDGSMLGTARARCRTHGFDCPELKGVR